MGGAIGDAYIVTTVQHHDRRIPIPGYDALGVAKRTLASGANLAAAIGAKTGPCSTGNSLDCPEIDAKAMKESGAVVKEMECAAIAWAAELFNTPMLALKVVTDIVDGEHPTQDEFLKNLSTAAQSLQEAVPKVMDFIAGKELKDL